MRSNNQNSQNKRSRGRNNPNRNRQGGGNPLTRNYESNGPDVKVRGNAANIVEKYVQLARDAQNASDSVAEQNYLQHAEHYLRIISAANAQNLQRQEERQALEDRHVKENQERQAKENQTKKNIENKENPEVAKPSALESGEEQAVTQENNQTDVTSEDAIKEVKKPVVKPRVRRPRRQPRTAQSNDESGAKQDKIKDKMPQSQADGLQAFLTAGEKPDAAE